MPHRYPLPWRVLCLVNLALAAHFAAAEETRGLSLRKPVKGPFVETDQGYMVPYRTTIPGTDVAFEMVPIEGGTVQLRQGDMSVAVPVEPIWVGKYEVTRAEYSHYRSLLESFKKFDVRGLRKVTREHVADVVTAPSTLYDYANYEPGSANKREWPRHPAVAMTQYAARQYTKWLSKLTGDFYRLPSEAEWEYACRAGSNTRFSFGDDQSKLGEYAWYSANSGEDTHVVGSKRPNAWGLYDMHGNASEWVLDQYGSSYAPLQRAVAAGQTAVRWPSRLHPRTVRGGSWDSAANDCDSAARLGSSAEWHEEEPLRPYSPHWLCSPMQRQIGFRIVRPLRYPPPESHGKFWDADVNELKQAVVAFTENGHSSRGRVDPQLPAAIERLSR